MFISYQEVSTRRFVEQVCVCACSTHILSHFIFSILCGCVHYVIDFFLVLRVAYLYNGVVYSELFYFSLFLCTYTRVCVRHIFFLF